MANYQRCPRLSQASVSIAQLSTSRESAMDEEFKRMKRQLVDDWLRQVISRVIAQNALKGIRKKRTSFKPKEKA